MSETTLNRETSTLISYLDAQRHHVLGILDGLDDNALHRPALPSGWVPLGLVQHLAVDVERFWFGAVVAGDRTLIDSFDEREDPWQVDPDMPAASVFDLYRQEIERANAIITATPMDASPAWWPADLFGDFRLDTVREIVLHVITEAACHAGHLDAVRELIDGTQWMALDD